MSTLSQGYSKIVSSSESKTEEAELNMADLITSADTAEINYERNASCCLPGYFSEFGESCKFSLHCNPFLKSFKFKTEENGKIRHLKGSVEPGCLCFCKSKYFFKFESSPGIKNFNREEYSFKMEYSCCLGLCKKYDVFSKGENKCGTIELNCCNCCLFPSFTIKDEYNNPIYTVSSNDCFNCCYCPKETHEISWPIKSANNEEEGKITWKVTDHNSCCCCFQGESHVDITCKVQFPEIIEYERKVMLMGCLYLIDSIMFNAIISGKEFNN